MIAVENLSCLLETGSVMERAYQKHSWALAALHPGAAQTHETAPVAIVPSAVFVPLSPPKAVPRTAVLADPLSYVTASHPLGELQKYRPQDGTAITFSLVFIFQVACTGRVLSLHSGMCRNFSYGWYWHGRGKSPLQDHTLKALPCILGGTRHHCERKIVENQQPVVYRIGTGCFSV